MAKLLGKRSEAFIRAEIMDQGRAIHGVSKEDNDITREVLNIKYFTAQAVATVESATQSQGKKVLKKLKKDVFRLVTSVGKEKTLSPHEESNLRFSDSALRCSTTEPQRIHDERGLLRSSYDTCPAYC